MAVTRTPPPSWIRRWATSFRLMSWPVRREYATVMVLSAAAELGLRVVRLDRLSRLFGVRLVESAADTPAVPLENLPPWALQRLRIVGTVMGKWPVDGVCLRKSLVAGQRLRSLDPRLKIGIARLDEAVSAHAWLEIGGRTLDGTSALYDELPPPAS